MGQVNVNTGGGRRWSPDNGTGLIAFIVLLLVGFLIWFVFFSGNGDAPPADGGEAPPATEGSQQGEEPAPSGWKLVDLA